MSVPAGSVSYLPFTLGEKAESGSQLKHISRLQTHNVPFKPERLTRQRILGDKRCGLEKKKNTVDREPYLVTLCLTSVFNISLLLSEMTMQKLPMDASINITEASNVFFSSQGWLSLTFILMCLCDVCCRKFSVIVK